MAPSDSQSGTSTPKSFTNQLVSTEDLLKSQTVGLVHLDDFRKRRAEVLERKEKEAQDRNYIRFNRAVSGVATPTSQDDSDGGWIQGNEIRGQPPKKKKKRAPKGLLSFGDDEDEVASGASSSAEAAPCTGKTRSPDPRSGMNNSESIPKRLTSKPNSLLPAPTVLTKAALQAEAVARDNLRKEFLIIQEAVRNTEIVIPFVFYDGTNIPGGLVKVKKGDHIWLFLDRCRKVGAELGVSGGGTASGGGPAKNKNDNRREWARVGVDDLLCVRGEVIIPHHYEFYYFIANRIASSSRSNALLFDYANAVMTANSDKPGPIMPPHAIHEELEGKDMDPSMTKVVDRRWYEKNKHIFPASLWKEYEAGEGFEEKLAQSRRDAQGNAFFFS